MAEKYTQNGCPSYVPRNVPKGNGPDVPMSPHVPRNVLSISNENNDLQKVRTLPGHGDIEKRQEKDNSGHTPPTFRLGCPELSMSRFLPDWSELNEKVFSAALARIFSVDELEGVANRKKWLRNPDLPNWKDWQRELILRRKWELEQNEQNAKRTQRRKRARS